MKKQQNQALTFFDSYANEWFKSGNVANEKEVNVIAQRNNYVLSVIESRPSTKSFLDIGCGTGDLVREAARKGVQSCGVDFAKEMIRLAQEHTEPEIKRKTEFICASIFDFDLKPNAYDVISMNGFIEYITYDELVGLMKKIFAALKPGGSVVVGSRNRLFNMVSFNRFTKDEIDRGYATGLLKEVLFWAGDIDPKQLKTFKTVGLQEEGWEHHDTGIKVQNRYQYTPVQLIQVLAKLGFGYSDIHPIHIHAISPELQKAYPEVHVKMSIFLSGLNEHKQKFIPYASSYMLHMTKAMK